MEIRLKHNGQVVDEHAFRTWVKDTGMAHNPPIEHMLPEFLTPEMIDHFGGDVVLASPMPSTTHYQTVVRDGITKDGLGNWVQAWKVNNWGPEAIVAFKAQAIEQKILEIKAERDRRKSGGIFVKGHWWHTDVDSRIQWLGLKDDARDLLDAGGAFGTRLQVYGQDITWKPMESDVQVPVDVQMTFDNVKAVKELDAVLFAVAKQHIAALSQVAHPHLYDYSAGWPPRYQDVY